MDYRISENWLTTWSRLRIRVLPVQYLYTTTYTRMFSTNQIIIINLLLLILLFIINILLIYYYYYSSFSISPRNLIELKILKWKTSVRLFPNSAGMSCFIECISFRNVPSIEPRILRKEKIRHSTVIMSIYQYYLSADIFVFYHEWLAYIYCTDHLNFVRVLLFNALKWYSNLILSAKAWGPLPGGRGGGRPPRFWRKIFQYISSPRFWGLFCSEMI